MSFNIAIDGPAGAGKSTIAKAVAKKLNMIYVDTGAMYRAMALFMLRENIAADDVSAVSEKCKEAYITISHEGGEQVVWLNGENVNAFLRTEEVGKMASVTSAQPAVREKLTALQKQLAAENDCVMDGRDIGTCVLPNAQVKIYLTADSKVRAKRRVDDLAAHGESCDFEQILKNVEERDYRDMHREHSPLRQAEDAVLVDSSNMGIEEVTARIIGICEEKCEKKF